VNVTNWHLVVVAARSLSTIMRMLNGIGSPRSLQGLRALLQTAENHLERLGELFNRLLTAPVGYGPWGSNAIGG
jgi:hypothetical protein